MGTLFNLFKQKSAKPKAAQAEGRAASALSAFSGRSKEAAPQEEEIAEAPSAVEKTDDAPLKNIHLGGVKRSVTDAPARETQKNIAISPADAQIVEGKLRTRSIAQVKVAEVADQQVPVDLDDVLPQIPRGLLKADLAKGTKKTLLFSSRELLPSLAQGRASATVSRIAELAPELFGGGPIPPEAEVELPLQKIVSRIGAFPGRPGQVEEIYPPLDARYANLIVEKGGDANEEEPAATPAATAPAPAVIEERPPAIVAPPPAVAETATNGSEESHVEAQAEPPAETVSYSLAAILPNVPESWLVNGKSKKIDSSARITVPFDLIEMQIANGRVELPFTDFHRALPENLKDCFSGNKQESGAAKVVIPLHEVFQNLPGVEPLPPPPAKPEPEEPKEIEATPEPVAKVEEPGPAVVPELAVAPEPAEAKSEPQPEAVVQQPIVEEKKAEELEQTQEPEVSQTAPEPVATQTLLTEEIAPTAEEPEAKAEPVEPPAPEPAAAVEPQPAAPASAPEPQPAEEQPGMQFITPSIQIQRLAPPPIITTAAMAAPEPEPPAQPPVEAKSPEPAPASVEPVEPAALPVAATAEPPAPAEPAAPVEQAAQPTEPATIAKPPLTDLIATDGKLDPRKTVEHVILLPGVTAAALTIKGKTKTAGEIPGGFHAQETGKALFQSLENQGAKGSPAPALPRAITLHHDQFSGTWFKQNGIMLCVLHPGRSLTAEAHHAVLLVVQEIVRLRQH